MLQLPTDGIYNKLLMLDFGTLDDFLMEEIAWVSMVLLENVNSLGIAYWDQQHATMEQNISTVFICLTEKKVHWCVSYFE